MGDELIFNPGPGEEILRLRSEVASLREELAKKDLELQRLTLADEALRESQEKYLELFELGKESLFLIDNDTGRLLEANTAATEMYGYSRDELLRMRNVDLSAEPEDTHRVTTETPVGGVVVPLRYHRKRDGTVFPVEITGRFFSWKGRKVHVAAIRDISERCQTEAYLRKLSLLKVRLLGMGDLKARLQQIADSVIDIFGADFAHIWMIRDGDFCEKGCRYATVAGGEHACRDRNRCLHLMASSGRYTSINDDYRRVPIGNCQIGRMIMDEPGKYITNDVVNNPFVDDRDRALGLGLVSLAGFRILSRDGEAVGALALFKKTPINRNEELLLEDLVSTTSQVIVAGRAEEALKASETRFRSLIQHSSDIVRIIDRNGLIVYDSPSSELILGYPPGFMLGKSPLELIHPADRDRVARDLNEVFEQKNDGKPTEFRVRKADGSYLEVESLGSNMLGVPGVDGIVVTTRPVEDRKRAQEALRRSEKKYRELVESANSIIIRWDMDGTITFVNEFATRFFGYSESEMLGKNLIGLIVPGADTGGQYINTLTRKITEHPERYLTSVKKNVRKNGEFVWISWTNRPITDDAGNVIENLSVGNDITAQKLVEDERKLTVEFLRLVNESQDTRDLVHSATAFFQRYSGCEAVGVRLKEYDDYPYYEYRGFSGEFIAAENYLCSRDINRPILFEDGEPIYECLCGSVIKNRGDPSKPYFTARGSFWTNSTTELLACLGVAERRMLSRNRCNRSGYESMALIPLCFSDERMGLLQLNDRKKGRFSPEFIALWERLADYLAVALAKLRTEDALRESLKEKEVLLKEVHHRVKNNLQIITSLLNLQMSQMQDPDTVTALTESQSRIRSMALLHEKLYQSKDLSSIDFGDYLRGLISSAYCTYGVNEGLIRVEIDAGNVRLGIDTAIPCGLIINEISTNAFKYAFPRDRQGTLTIKVSSEESGQTELIISDDGVGLPEGFDIDNVTTLGLQLVVSLVHQLEGEIELKNEGGVTYRITFREKRHG
ncbi:PAS domain S-box protein [Methanocella arvoryzae]|uniref:Signal transduction histidine kinase n=1 Tax=Methanocella arvoryzae (strain DSM 22066 / NBRC 105507 / MRE50) TaxID=351160 RepID=Q0W832_METAR|nr:PAS domain S-box protein [Methanocella arvoryzae]CAJ35461.1 putative signal transduction histidine kinase [Methanocella arvoryzae MRE50]